MATTTTSIYLPFTANTYNSVTACTTMHPTCDYLQSGSTMIQCEIDSMDNYLKGQIQTIINATDASITSQWVDAQIKYDTSGTAIDWICNKESIHANFIAAIKAAKLNTWTSCNYKPEPIPGHRRLEEIIVARRAPAVIVLNQDRNPLQTTTDIREIRARQTLRRLVGDEQYRSFLKNSMVTIQAKSGRYYSVRPGHTMVKVWEKGEQVGNLCIQLSGSFPPTDSVIMRCLMIWNEEDEFWNRANKGGIYRPSLFKITPQEDRPLTKILAELKASTKQDTIAADLLKQRRDRAGRVAERQRISLMDDEMMAMILQAKARVA